MRACAAIPLKTMVSVAAAVPNQLVWLLFQNSSAGVVGRANESDGETNAAKGERAGAGAHSTVTAVEWSGGCAPGAGCCDFWSRRQNRS